MIPEVKICGLTDPGEARACAEAGASAIGLVFHPPSPRHLTPGRARDIVAALPVEVAKVGVFADYTATQIQAIADVAGLTALQLHGAVAMEALPNLLDTPYHIVAVLRELDGICETARQLPPGVALLVECGKGVLPGGNGVVWQWSKAAPLAAVRPFAVAGGITPATAAAALAESQAVGLDVSSGVESSPGHKDLALVRQLIAALPVSTDSAAQAKVFSR